MGKTRTVWALLAAVCVTAVGISAISQEPQNATLTGCLRTGSAPDVLLLRGASLPGEVEAPAQSQMPRDYLVVSMPGGVDAAGLINHRVEVTGSVSDARTGPPPPDGANAAERALRRLSATGVREVAPTCG